MIEQERIQTDRPDRDMIRRQVLGHLQSLRGAGLDWLPSGPALDIAAALGAPPDRRAIGAALNAGQSVTAAESSSTAIPTVTAPGESLEQRRIALETLAAEVRGCTSCTELASTRTQTVFADGKPGADLCFIGEAPGADEDAQGLPFVGAAGQLLNKIIAACGFQREEVYICNILKCRPPGNRAPLPHEAANCRGFLERQLALVQPKFICAMGSSAASNLLQTNLSIGKLRGRFHDWKGIPVIATYHPAYLLPHRAPEKKKEVWDDMKMLLQKMGRPIPPRGQ